MFEKLRLCFFIDGLQQWVATELRQRELQDLASAMVIVERLENFKQGERSRSSKHEHCKDGGDDRSKSGSPKETDDERSRDEGRRRHHKEEKKHEGSRKRGDFRDHKAHGGLEEDTSTVQVHIMGETNDEEEFKAFEANENEELTNREEPFKNMDGSKNTHSDDNAQNEKMKYESIDKEVKVHEGQNVNNSDSMYNVDCDNTICSLRKHWMITQVTYPNMMEFFESLGVDMEASDMSLSVSLERGQGCEWGSRNGISSLFAQKKNALNPYFWQMLREINKFKDDVMRYLEDLENNAAIDRNETLGQFIKSHGYSEFFQKAYLVRCLKFYFFQTPDVFFNLVLPFRRSNGLFGLFSPLILSQPPSTSGTSFILLFILKLAHRMWMLTVSLNQLFGRPQWLTARWRSHDYVNKVREELECRSCEIRSGCTVQSVSTVEEGCVIISEDGSEERYDGCIIATHAPDTLKILGELATHDERRVLGAFNYVYSDIYLHRDTNLMPQNPAAWSAWNFLGNVDNKLCLTYWLNVLQNIDEKGLPYLVTLNPSHTPEHTLLKWSTGHPIPSVAASKASLEIDDIQGKRGIWFCGAYQGYGFHEDGLKAGMVAAHGILRKSCAILKNPKHMVPSLVETGARLFVTRFLGNYIASGCLILLEEGGTIFTFEGNNNKSSLKVYMKVLSPKFYWKASDFDSVLAFLIMELVVTEADLGLADAYINGDFSFVDKKEGLLNLFMMLIANRDVKTSNSRFSYRSMFHGKILTQARRNISRHYDLSNELFALFLDETMTYSCAVFKTEDEDLKIAQMRKISGLIEKARIKKGHKILEIGSGWGSLAIELVRQTGCNYTGITLSEEQLRYAEMEVKKAGLQDHIRFLLCDYRQLPEIYKYDRIICCEMLEEVGHEYMEEFFTCCESVLAKDGLFVLQFISIPDERKFISPSKLIVLLKVQRGARGKHRDTLLSNTQMLEAKLLGKAELLRPVRLSDFCAAVALVHLDKAINRTSSLICEQGSRLAKFWLWVSTKSSSGRGSTILTTVQPVLRRIHLEIIRFASIKKIVVFSRPGNTAAFSDPYEGVPSAYCSLPL
ncbi:hypothetical protein RJ640_002616 [Escallonia rubra]|uniref:Cyclopropane-fatty-acyl-phospholipid synthase n=1 Tax=Escallonia rubra TaxID=112253 RepID=A0AA88UEH1_9ASTE|nr:hypothetical protein RJ640_002616 [Escallonia rubra]